MISYDQHKDKDYTPVWTLLKQWGAVRILESVWLVDIGQKATWVRDTLRAKTHEEDSVMVIQIFPNSDWSTFGSLKAGVDWLKKYSP